MDISWCSLSEAGYCTEQQAFQSLCRATVSPGLYQGVLDWKLEPVLLHMAVMNVFE